MVDFTASDNLSGETITALEDFSMILNTNEIAL